MIRPTDLEAREEYRIWIRYSDGVAGEIDLSHLAGRGVFAVWLERSYFENVRITPDGAVAWGEDIELCPDALYLQLTGKSVREYMPQVDRLGSHA
ncbi:MAG: DUF2442 domain-containing protein [Chloroflexi bacterium]|nr:DUF2442 domain-containing protein [Chloroflexota bacterium]